MSKIVEGEGMEINPTVQKPEVKEDAQIKPGSTGSDMISSEITSVGKSLVYLLENVREGNTYVNLIPSAEMAQMVQCIAPYMINIKNLFNQGGYVKSEIEVCPTVPQSALEKGIKLWLGKENAEFYLQSDAKFNPTNVDGKTAVKMSDLYSLLPETRWLNSIQPQIYVPKDPYLLLLSNQVPTEQRDFLSLCFDTARQMTAAAPYMAKKPDKTSNAGDFILTTDEIRLMGKNGLIPVVAVIETARGLGKKDIKSYLETLAKLYHNMETLK